MYNIFSSSKITETLAVLDRPDLHPYERSEALSTIRRDIAATWGSDEIRRTKPTPQQEAAGGNAMVETVLWEAVSCIITITLCHIQIRLIKLEHTFLIRSLCTLLTP